MAKLGEPDGAASDESLVARAVVGDERAFTALVDRHQDRLFRFLRFALQVERAEAEDLAQEIFIQVHRALPSFEGRSRFQTWLFGIAKNICRRRGSHPCWSPDAQADDGALLDVPDQQLDPLAMLERHQVQNVVRGAIDSLSPLHRAVVFLRDIDGLTYDEIAQALDLPVGTVRSRLHNARARLAVRLLGTR